MVGEGGDGKCPLGEFPIHVKQKISVSSPIASFKKNPYRKIYSSGTPNVVKMFSALDFAAYTNCVEVGSVQRARAKFIELHRVEANC